MLEGLRYYPNTVLKAQENEDRRGGVDETHNPIEPLFGFPLLTPVPPVVGFKSTKDAFPHAFTPAPERSEKFSA
jgi:hypothetical protein